MGVSDLKAKAREAFKRKSYDHAVEIYIEALQFGPDDAEALEGFLQAAQKAREGHGRSIFGGIGRLALGTVRGERKCISTVRHLARNPDDKSAWMTLGEAAEAQGFLNTSQFSYRTAARLDPDDNEAWKRLGAVLYRQGRIKEAMEAYDQAVRIDPKDQEAIKARKNLAAEGALKVGGYETAKSSRELLRDKDQAGRLERDQRLQMTSEDATDEAARLRAEVAKDPGQGSLRTRRRLAEVLRQKGDREGALEELVECQRLDPTNYDLSVEIGDVRLGQVQEVFEAARARFKEAETDANRAALEKARAELLAARLAEYARRVREHPTDLTERYRLGATLQMAGRVDEAIGEFQKTVQDPRRKTDSLLRLGECFEKKGLLDLAAKQVAKASEDFPNLNSERAKEIVYRLAELHERRGAKEDARREYTRIYEVDIAYRDVSAKIAALSG